MACSPATGGHSPYRLTYGPTTSACSDCGTVWSLACDGRGRPLGWRNQADDDEPRRPAPTGLVDARRPAFRRAPLDLTPEEIRQVLSPYMPAPTIPTYPEELF